MVSRPDGLSGVYAAQKSVGRQPYNRHMIYERKTAEKSTKLSAVFIICFASTISYFSIPLLHSLNRISLFFVQV